MVAIKGVSYSLPLAGDRLLHIVPVIPVHIGIHTSRYVDGYGVSNGKKIIYMTDIDVVPSITYLPTHQEQASKAMNKNIYFIGNRVHVI